MSVTGFDHVALPTERPEAMIEFYGHLGFRVPSLDEWRNSKLPFFSIFFGEQKINFHTPEIWRKPEFTLRGPTAQPGCGDLCFVWSGQPGSLERALGDAGAEIEVGPVEMHGARGIGTSLYVRDPDQNLVEFIVYSQASG